MIALGFRTASNASVPRDGLRAGGPGFSHQPNILFTMELSASAAIRAGHGGKPPAQHSWRRPGVNARICACCTTGKFSRQPQRALRA